jgi:excisionase family DNA binding protein
MSEAERRNPPDEMLDVRRAAALTGRHPETIRRWIWSGRIVARREGNRLLVARDDVEALAASRNAPPVALATWAERARRAHRDADGSRSSAAEFMIQDRSG